MLTVPVSSLTCGLELTIMVGPKLIVRCTLLFLLIGFAFEGKGADSFDTFIKPLFAGQCVKCHGGEKTKGKVNLTELPDTAHFLTKPQLLNNLIKVIDAREMPPENEPPLTEADRTRLLASLKSLLSQSAARGGPPSVGLRRLNRYQYNNAVRDLFQLRRDVFSLPEKLMTRNGDYLRSDKMPDKVSVACLALRPAPGFQEVNPFPKDLRAAHGYDNQANQLTLSPLLLDSFLKLSVSILQSPDFTEYNVGIWNGFFRAPAPDSDSRAEISRRMAPFLRQAFRRAVDAETVQRYTDYAVSQTKRGLSFTDSMKKAASAVMSSPLFLYRFASEDAADGNYQLASRLSFFLWGSSPDAELLRLAETGELSQPASLNQTITRLLADPKIERFLDTFPAQWMQLENVLSATPDPAKARLFSLDRSNPASTHMVLEPLLLFDAVFLENRPLSDLIKPPFSYQSDFLRTWYHSDLKPPVPDVTKLLDENRTNEAKRQALTAEIQNTRAGLDALLDPVKTRLLAARQHATGTEKRVDLQPFAAWEFNDSLKDTVGSLELRAKGKLRYRDGMLILEKNAHLQSDKLPIDLKAKTLEVWCRVHDLGQSGGGLMGIQGRGDLFDTIVLGERKRGHWISGSNGFARTEDFPGSFPEESPMQDLHLVMVYAGDGTTTLYRNGKPYGKPYRKGATTFPAQDSTVIFGVRHLPAGGNRHLSVSLAKARLYTRALTADEVAASNAGGSYLPNDELVRALTPEQRIKREALTNSLAQSEQALKAIPKTRDPGEVQREAAQNHDRELLNKLRSTTFERVAATDPRYGGVITTAAMASMTSGPDRTHPIARGAWIIEVILNDPPPPPPNNVPPLKEDDSAKDLTIREQFAEHRKNPDCAGCHSRLDPLGFAMENFDITGRWRDKYENGRKVDASGTFLKKYPFDGIVDFKESLVKENRRFASAFTGHLLRFALSRELTPADSLAIDAIVSKTEGDNFKLKSLLREIVLSDAFLQPR